MSVYSEFKCGGCKKTVRAEGGDITLPEGWAVATMEDRGVIEIVATLCPVCKANTWRAMTGRKRLPKAKKPVEEVAL